MSGFKFHVCPKALGLSDYISLQEGRGLFRFPSVPLTPLTAGMTRRRCGSPASNPLSDFLSFNCLEISVKNHLGNDAFFVPLKIKNKWPRRNEKPRIRLWQKFLRLRAQCFGLH